MSYYDGSEISVEKFLRAIRDTGVTAEGGLRNLIDREATMGDDENDAVQAQVSDLGAHGGFYLLGQQAAQAENAVLREALGDITQRLEHIQEAARYGAETVYEPDGEPIVTFEHIGILARKAIAQARPLLATGENAELRALLSAFVEADDAGLYEVVGYKFCAYCHVGNGRWMVDATQHTPDCPIARAREWLAKGAGE